MPARHPAFQHVMDWAAVPPCTEQSPGGNPTGTPLMSLTPSPCTSTTLAFHIDLPSLPVSSRARSRSQSRSRRRSAFGHWCRWTTVIPVISVILPTRNHSFQEPQSPTFAAPTSGCSSPPPRVLSRLDRCGPGFSSRVVVPFSCWETGTVKGSGPGVARLVPPS